VLNALRHEEVRLARHFLTLVPKRDRRNLLLKLEATIRVGLWQVGEKFFKKSHRCYFVKVTDLGGRRKDRRMNTDAEPAEMLRCELITTLRRHGTPSADYLVRDLVFRFLDHVKTNNRPGTYSWRLNFLESFCNALPPDLKVANLKLHHAQAWLRKNYSSAGNPNTQHGAISTLKRVFNWAFNDMGYLDVNPFAKLKKPALVPCQTFVTRTQWDEVLALAPLFVPVIRRRLPLHWQNVAGFRLGVEMQFDTAGIKLAHHDLAAPLDRRMVRAVAGVRVEIYTTLG